MRAGKSGDQSVLPEWVRSRKICPFSVSMPTTVSSSARWLGSVVLRRRRTPACAASPGARSKRKAKTLPGCFAVGQLVVGVGDGLKLRRAEHGCIVLVVGDGQDGLLHELQRLLAGGWGGMRGRLAEIEAAGESHFAAAGQRGQLGGVLPVAHPGDPDGVAIGREVGEGCGGVEVLAPIGPVRAGVGMVFSEARAVELADEVLIGGAAGASAGVDVDAEQPAVGVEVAVAVAHRQLE